MEAKMKEVKIRTGEYGDLLFALQRDDDSGEYALNDDNSLMLLASFGEATSYMKGLTGKWNVQGCRIVTPQD
jgi:hypothetical protein